MSSASPTSQALHLIHLASRTCWFNEFSLIMKHLWHCWKQHKFSLVSQRPTFSQHCLTVEEKPRKTSTRKTDATGDRTRTPLIDIEIYSRAHCPTFSSLDLRHKSFSNPSVALPTSQINLQPFRCFTYVTVHSPTLLSLLLRHKLFT